MDDAKRRGRQFIQELEQRLRSHWGWFAYLPPEGRDALMLAVNDARLSAPGDRDVQLAAAYCINELLCTTQTTRHLDNTLERLSYQIGEKTGATHGRMLLSSLLDDTAFAGAITQAETRLASAEPMIGQPFLRNDEPSFFAATLPLHGAIYTA